MFVASECLPPTVLKPHALYSCMFIFPFSSFSTYAYVNIIKYCVFLIKDIKKINY